MERHRPPSRRTVPIGHRSKLLEELLNRPGQPGGPCRAIGAAALPPAPAPTSITATAIFGRCAGAKATNQASVFFGSGGPPAVGRSSAVPVLPATSMPGSAAAVPVPERTTASIIVADLRRPSCARHARLRMTGSLRDDARRGCTPRLAIVAPTDAICSGVARSRSCPIAPRRPRGRP